MCKQYGSVLYNNAKAWIIKQADEKGDCKIVHFDENDYETSSILHFRIIGSTGSLIEDFLKIFPQFNIYNIHTDDIYRQSEQGVTFVLSTKGETH